MEHNDQLFRRAEAAAYLGISLSTFDASIRGGSIPPGIPLTKAGRVKAWKKSTLAEYVDHMSEGNHAKTQAEDGAAV